MKILKSILLGVSIVITSSCDQSETDNDITEIEALTNITLSVSYINDATMTIEPTLADPLTNLIFPFISGAIGGYPSSENLIVVAIGDDRKVTLQLSPSIFTINTYPALIDPSLASSGISITPIDTNFGRLAQFDEYEGHGDEGPYALYDNENKFYFSIVYFDKAASLTGTVNDEGSIVIYDIHVPSSGFYAVKVITTATGGNLVAANLSSDLHFVYRR